jgi:hypothetical protein
MIGRLRATTEKGQLGNPKNHFDPLFVPYLWFSLPVRPNLSHFFYLSHVLALNLFASAVAVDYCRNELISMPLELQ